MSNQSNSATTPAPATQNEKLGMLQECIVAGSTSTNASKSDIIRTCQQQFGYGSKQGSPMNIFLEVLKSRVDDLQSALVQQQFGYGSKQGSPMNIFLEVLKSRVDDLQSSLSIASSSSSSSTRNAHTALIQDFNTSSKVWRFSL
eukprot:CAMPEP_0171384840 /NCGR_PEP_ID=MMETSP0879-20121228/38677_1 /TAXON_ID=67004 /ORGANISM="Thalassiosira weissflogii, Strain CCMP1336" /LENGTH=143 /DNA_ID=CAMNT_0011897125 /DNA_START=594 /DNA_END=1026 /DNA_ORIENTATION=-